MKSDCVHLRIFGTRGYFFLRKPTFVAATELQFVTVSERFFRTDDGIYPWQFHLAYTCQLVKHLLFFHLQLLTVRHILPLASPAHPEMGAPWLYTHIARLDHSYNLRLAIAVASCGALASLQRRRGTANGTNTTRSLTLANDFPSAA